MTRLVVRLLGPNTWGVRNAFLSISWCREVTFGVGGKAVDREKGQTALLALAISQVSLIENNQDVRGKH